MAKQTFTTGQVLTAAQMTSLQQTAMGGGSTTAKTASYVLVAADAGTIVQMNAAGATTITVNTALFAAGDSVQIQNIGAGVCTVTAGTATVSTAGSLALSQYEGGQLYFNTTSAALFFDIFQGASTATFVGARVYGSAVQSITTATTTLLTWNTESYDTDAFHDTSTNTGRFTIPAGKAGKYLLNIKTMWDSSSNTGGRNLILYKNGAAILDSEFSLSTRGNLQMSLVSAQSAAVADYFEVYVFQSTGGSIDLNKTSLYSEYSISYLGA